MSPILLTILVLITFVLFVVYCIRGGNVIVGFVVMALIWGLLSGLSVKDVLGQVIQGSTMNAASLCITVIFAAWFGQVMMKTGIIPSMIKKVTELAGGRPVVTTLVLCLVSMLIFTSSYGSGMVIAIGLIILPVLTAVGLTNMQALSCYLMSIAGGCLMHPMYKTLIGGYVPTFDMANYNKLVIPLMVLQYIALVGYLLFQLRKKGKKANRAWAAEISVNTEETKDAPVWSFICPIIPVLLIGIAKLDPVPSYLIAILCAFILTGLIIKPKEASDLLIKALRQGVADVAFLLGLLLTMFMFTAAAGLHAGTLSAVLGPIFPQNPVVLAIVLAVLCPLALYRGPLNCQGSGAALIPIFSAVALTNPGPVFAVLLLLFSSIVSGICPTYGWVAWGIGYSKVETSPYLKQILPWQWGLVIIGTLLSIVLVG